MKKFNLVTNSLTGCICSQSDLAKETFVKVGWKNSYTWMWERRMEMFLTILTLQLSKKESNMNESEDTWTWENYRNGTIHMGNILIVKCKWEVDVGILPKSIAHLMYKCKWDWQLKFHNFLANNLAHLLFILTFLTYTHLHTLMFNLQSHDLVIFLT